MLTSITVYINAFIRNQLCGEKTGEVNVKDSLLESSEKVTFSKKEFCIIHLSSLNFFFLIHWPVSTNAKQKVEIPMNFPKPSV